MEQHSITIYWLNQAHPPHIYEVLQFGVKIWLMFPLIKVIDEAILCSNLWNTRWINPKPPGFFTCLVLGPQAKKCCITTFCTIMWEEECFCTPEKIKIYFWPIFVVSSAVQYIHGNLVIGCCAGFPIVCVCADTMTERGCNVWTYPWEMREWMHK